MFSPILRLHTVSLSLHYLDPYVMSMYVLSVLHLLSLPLPPSLPPSLPLPVSESSDDDKLVAWRWEEVKGPLRDEKVTGNTPILTLSRLVPGSYTFT